MADSGKTSVLFDEAFLKKIEYLYVMSKKVFTGKLRAERKTRKAATGIEFVDHRNYSPGDDLRALDWKIYGRTEKLLVRLFEEDEELTIYFLVDASLSMRFGDGKKLDYAKRMAAALGYIGLCNMDRVSYVPFAEDVIDRLAPTSGRGQIFKVFQFLDKLKGQGTTSFEEAFRSFSAASKRRGVAVVISDFFNPTGYEKALNFLHYGKFETYVIHIVDDQELGKLQRGDLSLIDAESGERLDVTMTPKLAARYQQALDDMSLKIEGYCDKRQMLYFKTPVSVPFDEIIMRVFRAGGFLK